MEQPAKGYYSIIQYCPDMSRMEAANIGVMLLCHARAFCKAKMADNTRRVKKFFSPHLHGEWWEIESSMLAIAERIEHESEDWLAGHGAIAEPLVSRFINRLANQIQMTPLRPMRVCDPEAELAELFEDLVDD